MILPGKIPVLFKNTSGRKAEKVKRTLSHHFWFFTTQNQCNLQKTCNYTLNFNTLATADARSGALMKDDRSRGGVGVEWRLEIISDKG